MGRGSSAVLCFKWALNSKCKLWKPKESTYMCMPTPPWAVNTPSHPSFDISSWALQQVFADKEGKGKFGTLSGLWCGAFFVWWLGFGFLFGLFFPAVLLTVWRSFPQNMCTVVQQVGSNIGFLCRISLGFLLCVPSLLPQAHRL